MIATFKLTEGRGPGQCGTGVGHLAETAFLIEKRHTVQWRRTADPVQPDSDSS